MKVNIEVNSNTEEQQKRIERLKNRLRISKETIRELSNTDLKKVAGGVATSYCGATCPTEAYAVFGC